MKPHRSGSMLMEVAVAMVLLALVLTGVAQLLVVAGRQSRALDARRLVITEASNLLDLVLAQPYEALTAETVSQVQLSDEFQQFLPTAKAEVELATRAGANESKRLQVRISWQNAAGLSEQVQLVAWKFPLPAGSEAP